MDVKYIIMGVFVAMIAVAIYLGMNMIKTETIGTITIVVNTPDGNPAAGITVMLKTLDGQVVSQSVTGDDGTAIFVGVTLNRAYLVEAQSDQGMLSERISPSKDGESFVFTLRKAGEGSAEGDRPNL